MEVLSGIVASLALLVGAGLVAGFTYQRGGGWLDRRRLLSPGRMIDIGDGHQLYVLEMGQHSETGKGSPAVIFESGFAATSLNWLHVQRAVAGQTHAVSYDRCGLGWSSAQSRERTPKQITAELRTMLQAAGIQPPYVLVGHSFGGLVMRRYALEHPDDVCGLVLVDPMRTCEWPPVDASQAATVARARRLSGHAVRFAHIGMARLAAQSLLCRSGKFAGCLVRLGGSKGGHLADRLTGEISKMPAEIRPAVAAHWGDPDFYRGLIAHLDALSATVNEMHETEPVRDLPVVVLTPASATPLSAEDLGAIGTHATQIIAERSEHWVHLDQPELVIAEILEMVAANPLEARPARVRFVSAPGQSQECVAQALSPAGF